MSEIAFKLEVDPRSAKRASKEIEKGSRGKTGAGSAAAGGFAGGLLGSILGGLGVIGDLMKGLIGLVNYLVAPFVPLLLTIIKPVFLMLQVLMGYMLKFYKDPAGSLDSLFSGIAGKASSVTGIDSEILKKSFAPVMTFFDGIIRFWKGFLDLTAAVVAGDLSSGMRAVGSMVSGVLETVMSTFFFIPNLLLTGVESLASLVDEVFGTSFAEVFSNIRDIFANMLNFMVKFFTGDWQGAWDALKGVGQNLYNILVNILTSAFSVLQGIGSWILDKIKSMFDSVKNTFSSFGGKVKDFFVNDAVITPQGNVIRTNPNDYLIATQNPQGMGGGGNITVNVTGVIDENMLDLIGQRIQDRLRYG